MARWKDHETTKKRQAFLDAIAPGLIEKAHGPLPLWTGPRKLSDQFSFRGDAQTLAIASWPSATQTSADEALAWGLALGGDRDVVLVLPSGLEIPTLQRLPWVSTPVSVFTFDAAGADGVKPVVVPSKAEVLDTIHSWGPRGRGTDAYLGETREAWIVALLTWLQSNPELAERHRQSYLSWHAYGRQVLRITSTANSVTIEAGVRYSKPTTGQPMPLPPIVIHEQLSPADLDRIESAVVEAIGRRRIGTDAGHEEHRVQHALAESFDQGHKLIGLSQLRREFPAWRPGHSPAYIDFLGADTQLRPHVVEVKLNNDVMLALQGLDYWVWAVANPDVLTETLGSPANAEPVIDFVVGAHKSSKAVGPYTQRQLEALDGAITWRFHVATDWNTSINVESMPRRKVPAPPVGWAPATSPRHAQRLHDRLIGVSASALKGAGPYFATPAAGILPEALEAWNDLDARGLLHRHVDHVRSSQAFALNLLAGLDHPARSRIAVLAGIPDVAATGPIVFEFEDHLDRLGEATRASPHRTQVDATIACTAADGARTLLLIEVKLSEVDFGHCSAYQSPKNDRRDVCACNGPFGDDPEACFQLRNHDREHRRTYNLQLGPMPPTGNGCSFRLGTNQPMRNVALGRALIRDGGTDAVVHALLAPGDNPTIWRRWTEAKTALRGVPEVKLADLPAEQVIDFHDAARRQALSVRYHLTR